jgi:hypothetical protein
MFIVENLVLTKNTDFNLVALNGFLKKRATKVMIEAVCIKGKDYGRLWWGLPIKR